MEALIALVLICLLSFICGKYSAERKETEDVTKRFDKGSRAGDNAVRAYKLHKQK